MKRYRAKFNPNAKNVYGVSLVHDPAMEGEFIQFSKQEESIQFKTIDEGKRRVMGLILEPNKEIYRNQGGQEFTLSFTEQDVEDVAYNYQKQKYQNNSTIEHDNNLIDGVSLVELWIIENSKIDKSTNFGFSYPKGSWMGVMSFDNDSAWKDYQDGKIKGFSIDAFMQLEEINLTLKQVDMSETKEDSFINKFVDAIALAFNPKKEEVIVEEVVELAYSPKEDDEEKSKLAEADLAEDGMDVPPIEAPKEEGKSDAEVLSDLIKMLQDMLAPMKEESVAMSKKLSELEAKFSKQETELVALSKQPATQTVKKAPTQLDFSKMTEKEKFLYHRNND
jgi:uncharacterized coiled-coil protein SlyX